MGHLGRANVPLHKKSSELTVLIYILWTQDTTTAEIERLYAEIRKLKASPYQFFNLAEIDILALLTMIDNKVKNLLLKNKDQKKVPFIN